VRRQHAAPPDRESEPVRRALEKRYFISVDDLTPRVFYRLTDNWLELTVRFIAREHGTRELKDAIARAILTRFEQAAIEIASTTYEIVVAPTLRVRNLST
jgi:small-conductance mechanosensitive channel